MARILILEGNGALRMLIREAVAGAGHAPVEAEQTADAVRIVLSDPPDMLLLDDDRGGVALVRRLRAAGGLCRMPIIALSGRLDVADELTRAGAVCVLKKPVSPAMVVRAVHWACEVYGCPRPEQRGER